MTITATAADLFNELRASLGLDKVREAYRVYSRVLRVATDQKTDFDTLHLGSLYAKLDYLIREYHIERSIAHSINDTRVRLRCLLRLTDEELGYSRLFDLKAICQLVSILYAEPLPGDLLRLFPAESCRATDTNVVADYFRLYVSRYDNVFVYGTCEELPDDEEVCVCINYTGGHGNGDNSYLLRYLHRGVQLNIVRPSLYNGVYYPELIILDPDYLVDITTVASCFEEYAHDARISLFSKLRPVEDSEATMLGNLAGQLLDEEVHSGDQELPYAQSFASFVRDNAFKALTIGQKQPEGTTKAADVNPLVKIRDDGERQKCNIHRALREGLERRVGRYDRDRVILEPSFISEMLGLQGRMDFLQLDYRVLIEQKSGKGQWYPGMRDDMPPREQLKHRVQVLLYQAVLHYNHKIRNSDIQLLLLYSKYELGLIGVTPAPQLLYEAIRLRNEIAGLETIYCRGGISMLESLAPEQMRQLEVRDNFWEKYKLPELRSVLDPIRQATPVERAYFLRFVTFLANEHMLSKVGNKTKESSGFASKWHDSLEEKYQTGNIYDQLTLVSPDADYEGRVTELVFAFAQDRATEMSNFRLGDIVIAYQYAAQTEPDARRTIVIRGTIVDIGVNTLRVELRAPQSDKRVLYRSTPIGGGNQHLKWAIEHDFMESSYKSLYSGMHAFLSAPRERRDLLMMQRRPEVDYSLSLRGSYGSFDELALHVRQAKDFFLIIGPPGTGKTSYGMLYTLQEQLLEEGSQVLITSFTNRAVDEICGKLVSEGIDFIRLGNPVHCSPEYRDHVMGERLAQAQSVGEMRRIVQQARVFVGTTTTLSSSLALFRLKSLDLCIIDEASQILEPHLMGLLSARGIDGQAAIRKFVMIGDHKQLPAVVQQREKVSKVEDPLLNAIGLTDCRLSLFERLLSRYRQDPSLVYMLTRQGRMHQDIADWPNRMFYSGRLQVVPLDHQTLPIPPANGSDSCWMASCLTQRVVWVNVPVVEPVVADKVNMSEAAAIASLVLYIYNNVCAQDEAFDSYKTIGVIVPYRNQIAAVRTAIEQLGHIPMLHDITIDTVERYQGSQRDYILYGFTIQRPYQLNFLTNNTFEEYGMTIDRKLNVAMTRARKHLVMLGDASVVGQNELFAKLIAYVKERGGFIDLVQPR